MREMSTLQSFMLLEEMIASASLSHEDGCDCRVCRAAGGDSDAFLSILMSVQEAKHRE